MKYTLSVLWFSIALAASATAQQQRHQVLPATDAKYAGTYHVAMDTWTPGEPPFRGVNGVLYDNTCEVGFFASSTVGERYVDDGRIPSPTSPEIPGSPLDSLSWTGTQTSYEISYFEIAYCTYVPSVDVEVNFWDCFAGCMDATTLPPLATYPLMGFLPGSAAGGLQCWTVGIDLSGGYEFTMPADCTGGFDGSIPCSGCDNGSFASGAKLTGTGSPSVSNDTLVLTASHLEPSNAGLYFQANNDRSPGVLWGDGLSCAGGALKRLQLRFADPTGTSATTIGISAKAGNISPGDTKYYQIWYRDPAGSPCGHDFNSSNGYAITWLP